MTVTTAQSLREKHDGSLHGALDVRTWLRLLSCTTVIEKRLRRRFVERFDTTLPRFDVMAALERAEEGLTMGALSHALLVSNGNVTTLVRQLEAQGLVALAPAPGDRRTTIVALTAAGRRTFQELAEAHRGWISAMFEAMGDAQMTRLYDLLSDLKQAIASDPLEREGSRGKALERG